MVIEYWQNIAKPFIEIGLLWFMLYMLFVFIQGTRAVQVTKGIIVLVLMFFITRQLGLATINWMLTRLVAISVIGFIIIFQPELRRGLALLGQFGFSYREEEILDEIVKSIIFMSNRRIGGIIALEREIGLRLYGESGVDIDSVVTSELINTIFMPGTPLHDGGIIIKNGRIIAAGCLFPLTQNQRVSTLLGTRHRAAIGLTEETDAVCIVVSEETGAISVAVDGKLTKDLTRDTLYDVLRGLFKPKQQRHNNSFSNFGTRKK
ncbi:MAG: TIGR00159 family protein [Candidatus Omnitrophica bacterium CG07_land_8_20_14_0_80_42_15]|uniref:Diadenylate cyclase n=1 Tax=Candidatus Aquitaenariimonas noxiae TaxID=1974741 RepID=A0A2J0KW27_9BACT|nr:MAG: TIGR00159 family protein [Candidatus Omnitrophica bacterium CG07_land_8_20_14_0_80_42_15]